jgi:hypothetical protein
MRKPLKATFGLNARIDADTEERRRRLLDQLGCTMGELLDRSLRALEASLPDESKIAA